MPDKKGSNVYGAGKGYLSTGAAAGCKAGPAASPSSNRGRPGVNHQAPGRVHASGEEDVQPEESRGRSESPDVTISGPGSSSGGLLSRYGGGGRVRFVDEMSSCPSSTTVVNALGKRSYRKITRSWLASRRARASNAELQRRTWSPPPPSPQQSLISAVSASATVPLATTTCGKRM